jgi:5-methylcytosine-specific restriction endonuclease McrA
VTDIYSRLKSAEKSEAGKEWTRVPFLKIKTEGIAENSKRHELIEALGERLKRDAEVEPKRLSEERRRYERARLDAIDDKTRQGMAACRDLVEFTGSCVYCEAAITRGVNAHLDHIIPVAKGGVNSVDNLVWACDQCNLLKRDKSFHRFCKLGEFDPDPIVARLHALGKFI